MNDKLQRGRIKERETKGTIQTEKEIIRVLQFTERMHETNHSELTESKENPVQSWKTEEENRGSHPELILLQAGSHWTEEGQKPWRIIITTPGEDPEGRKEEHPHVNMEKKSDATGPGSLKFNSEGGKGPGTIDEGRRTWA